MVLEGFGAEVAADDERAAGLPVGHEIGAAPQPGLFGIDQRRPDARGRGSDGDGVGDGGHGHKDSASRARGGAVWGAGDRRHLRQRLRR